jgi:hypothetical protein
MRKPRPPHRVRRAHGPPAAFAGYKNVASLSLASFPSSFLFNNLTTSASQRSVLALYAHSALLPRILPLPARLPWSATPQLRKTAPARCGAASTRIRDPPYSFDTSKQLWCASPRIGDSHWLSYELDSVQTLSQSASSSHYHRLLLQRAPETKTPWTRPALIAAQWPVAEMP